MSKCSKVKNPCKICLGSVTQKTGLQCKGACESWVHYGCLNYTPGRIKDIKAGIINVTCPCPDCKTISPKEYRTDEPFSCTNVQCPANRPPQCENAVCPTNKEQMNQTSGNKVSGGMPCALGKCGVKDCKQHSSPNMNNMVIPPVACQPPAFKGMPPLPSSSDACIDFNKCSSGCSSNDNMVDNMRHGDNIRPMNMDGMPSLYTMEQMCNTVGLLSKQINDLMNRMQQVARPGPGANAPCTQRGPKALCPKPCYCPENPGHRK